MKEKFVHESGEAKESSPSKRSRPRKSHEEKEGCESEGLGTEDRSSQWLFRRGDLPEMMISDHLGDTSSMVESLTHEVKSWSLISSSKVVSKNPIESMKQQRAYSSNRALMKILLGGSRANKVQTGGGYSTSK